MIGYSIVWNVDSKFMLNIEYLQRLNTWTVNEDVRITALYNGREIKYSSNVKF